MFNKVNKIDDIVKEFKTPFHLYDGDGIRENLRNLKDAFSWNVGFKEYFAVKATPNPYILKLLKEEGAGADCSSLTELMLAEAVGFEGKDIMFSSNETPLEDYEKAIELNAEINLDDITHIDFLEKNLSIPKSISIRFNPGKDFDFSNKIMSSPEDAKYGFTFEQLINGINILKNKGVEEFGVHAFLASNTTNSEYYVRLAEYLFNTAVKVKQLTGISLKYLNLSGGIGIPYLPNASSVDIFKVGELVKEQYYKILSPVGLDNISIYTELGRYITGPFGCLVTKVIHRKDIYKSYIGVDACAANLMRPAMYGAYHHITVLNKTDKKEKVYDVVGGLCENNDKFAIDRELPTIEIGDYLIIHDTGAHGHAMGYNYNGKLRSAEILIDNDNVKMIRRAETPKDYFATLDFTEFKL